MNKQGGTEPAQNVFKTDLSKQQAPDTDAWYAPSMYNIVQQDGQDVHIVIKPDKDCEVNSGLGSIRGARMAEMSYSRARATQQQRLTHPMVFRYGQMQPTSWDDALDLVARVTVAMLKEPGGEDNLFVSAFDHGGAGGGYENTWGTGKLYFGAMKVKNIRIHNRPAYNSEVHATRDMGVGELNNCYEDAELADTIVAVGTNAYETQTNYFLNHWVPNLRGSSLQKKQQQLAGEPHAPGPHRHRRSAADHDGRRLRGRGRQGQGAAPGHRARAPTWCCSTRCSPTSPRRAGRTKRSSPPRPTTSTRWWRRTGPRSRMPRASPASARPTSRRPRSGSPSPRTAGAGARCSPTRRA